MKSKVLILLLFWFCGVTFSQQEITWQDLSKIKFLKKYFEEYDDYFMYPEFLPSVKALDGKYVQIKGYFLNIGADEKVYILSKGPMSSCYFCGQGGPETAIELQFKNNQHFKTDDIITISGILTLNQDDVNHFNYILTECKGKLIQ